MSDDVEIYHDHKINQITRFICVTTTCSICAAEVVSRERRPDPKVPLVVQCVESSFAHVYSLDKVTMQDRKLW